MGWVVLEGPFDRLEASKGWGVGAGEQAQCGYPEETTGVSTWVWGPRPRATNVRGRPRGGRAGRRESGRCQLMEENQGKQASKVEGPEAIGARPPGSHSGVQRGREEPVGKEGVSRVVSSYTGPVWGGL